MSVLLLYAMHRLQGVLPFNPTDRPGVSAMGSFNAAVSFVTNTNWQWYSGELTISHLTNMLGNTVQNFVSAAAGMVVVIALIRGITRTNTRNLGNFWVDLVRTLLRILLPLSLVFSVALISQGVIQNLSEYTPAVTIDQTSVDAGDPSTAITEQLIPGGPVASQDAIKELGTNGGGFYNANSAHPFSNPNGLTNILQIWALLLIPFSFVVAFGRLVRDKNQGRVLMAVMATILLLFSGLAMLAEQHGNPGLTALGADQSLSVAQSGGNMEGKETRFGPAASGLFAGATTGTSTGAVNSMHDSCTPIGGLSPMVHMMLGEVSPGGVGVGLGGMLIMALLAVFIAGLMVGRTPEFLGKKGGQRLRTFRTRGGTVMRIRSGLSCLVVAALALAACGSDEDSSSDSAPPESAGTTEQSMTTSPDAAATTDAASSSEPPATDAVASGEPVKVMMILDESAAVNLFQDSPKAGAQARVDRINAEGGLGGSGQPVELDFCITDLDPNKALACAQEAADDPSYVAVAGSQSSTTETSPVFEGAGLHISLAPRNCPVTSDRPTCSIRRRVCSSSQESAPTPVVSWASRDWPRAETTCRPRCKPPHS